MRDYYPHGKYKLPGTVYMRTLWTIRDYGRCKEQVPDPSIIKAVSYDGVHAQTNNVGDPTYETAASMVDNMNAQITSAIEAALLDIPAEYRKGVWMSVMHGHRYPFDADRSTYTRQKYRFVYGVAWRLHYIEHK